MPALNKFLNGKNIVISLILLLVYLVYSYLQSNELPQLGVNPKPTIAISPVPPVEDVIEEHEPDSATQSSQDVAGVSADKQTAQVVKVIDGDTIEVTLNGKNEKIRVIGLNTPETVDPRRPIQCFGREASNFAKQTLLGKNVILETDPSQGERDKYQRLLRFVFIDGVVDYGKMMIREGYGNEYTYDLPYKYQAEYKLAEQEARNAGRGLWSGACK